MLNQTASDLAAERRRLRRFFYSVWDKRQAGGILEPMEALVAGVLEEHPEYQSLLGDEDGLERDYTPEMGESNPFLHMSMHVAIREQVGADRPAGVREVVRGLLRRHDDAHALEHHMMECLGEVMWQAERDRKPADEARYLECLKGLA